MKFKLFSGLVGALLLTACSSDPHYLIVSPDLVNYPVTNVRYSGQSLELTVQDYRTSQHIMQINQKDRASELIPSQDSLAHLVNTELSTQYKKQGLSLNSFAANKLDITIEKALITVEQGFTSYDAKNEIVIQAKLDNGSQVLTKTFQITGKSNGPLTADFAVLGRDFNQQLSKLLAQLLADPEIKGAIR